MKGKNFLINASRRPKWRHHVQPEFNPSPTLEFRLCRTWVPRAVPSRAGGSRPKCGGGGNQCVTLRCRAQNGRGPCSETSVGRGEQSAVNDCGRRIHSHRVCESCVDVLGARYILAKRSLAVGYRQDHYFVCRGNI